MVKHCSCFVETGVDGEIVAVKTDKDTCYGLDEVGSRVWALIADPKRACNICETLCRCCNL